MTEIMERRVLGKTGLNVSALGFGGAEIGYEGATLPEVTTLLNQALDDGLNLIDTAAAYLQSEALIGEAIGHRRNEFVLVTKCGAIEGFSKSDWSKDGIVRTVEQSLKNLRTDHLDVLLLHSCGVEEMRSGEALDGLQAAKEKGYTRFVGYSGDSEPALFAVKSGAVDVLETSISIADQEAIDVLLPLARERNLGVIAKRPIANAAWRYAERPRNGYHVTYWKRLQKLRYPFLNFPTTVASTALRFTLSQPGVHCAIVGSTKAARWRDNAAILAEGPLPKSEIAAIRETWRKVADRSWVGQV